MPEQLRNLPAPNDGQGRVETGPVRFGDDWPGTFIRGDNAFYYAMSLRQVIHGLKTALPDHYQAGLAIQISAIEGLASDLEASDQRNIPKEQLCPPQEKG
jgi:hypothetical protein